MTNEYLTFAEHLADLARPIALKYFRQPLEVEEKLDLSPVTQADREIEQTLREAIIARYPEHGVFGEEGGWYQENATMQWVIDPIDGTRAFIAGENTFTTLIGLCADEVPILGVIDQAVMNERWVGARPYTRHSAPATSNVTSLKDARMSTTSMPHFDASERMAFDHVKAQAASCRLGGDAYLYGLLAIGAMDVVMDAGMKPYDFCALVNVVEEAGGVITDWQGKPLTMFSRGQVLAAATPELHAVCLAIITV